MGRHKEIDVLVKDLVVTDDLEAKQKITTEIISIARSKSIFISSIHELYLARAKGQAPGNFTIPVMNLRGLTYDLARAIFRVAIKINAGAFIFGLSKTEIVYTAQSPVEYTGVILAAAIKENFSGPVFIQANHFQVKDRLFFIDPEKELTLIKQLIEDAVSAGFLNMEIDSSTLIDLSKLTAQEQQKDNFEIAVRLTQFIREIQPEGVHISLGASIGEVEGRNTSLEELKVYLDGYQQALAPGVEGLDKLNVYAGEPQGGVALADGSLAQVKVDFDTLKNLSKFVQTHYSLAGIVQEAGVTLPTGVFHKFVEAETLEIHFAAYFQNLMFDSAMFPKDLKEKMYAWVKRHCVDDKRETLTEDQFLYRTRKKALGPFKKEIMDLPTEMKEGIAREIEAKFDFIFKQLKISDTKNLVATHIKPVDVKLGVRRMAAV